MNKKFFSDKKIVKVLLIIKNKDLLSYKNESRIESVHINRMERLNKKY